MAVGGGIGALYAAGRMGYFDSMLGAPPQSSKVLESEMLCVCISPWTPVEGRPEDNWHDNISCCCRRRLPSSLTMQL